MQATRHLRVPNSSYAHRENQHNHTSFIQLAGTTPFPARLSTSHHPSPLSGVTNTIFSPACMSVSPGAEASYVYNASTCLTFFAPRRGATAGPCFFTGFGPEPSDPANEVVEADAVEIGLADAGAAVKSA
jgi:hypothetical protein